MERYYFDWAATAIPGNPSSIHHTEGKAARQALEDARNRCAGVLGVKPDEIYFTSGGTESNALVLFSLLTKTRRLAYQQTADTASSFFIYSATEHPSIRENAAMLEQLGIPCTTIGVEQDGRVSVEKLEKTLVKNPQTRMAAIMAVNNETGAINDIKLLSAVIRKKQKNAIHIHCDAVQALGKIKFDLQNRDIDSASFSAHKFGGSRGIGLLWLKKPLIPLIRGGDQEKKIRPGTENTQGAIDCADALERLSQTEGYTEKQAALKTINCAETGAAQRMKAFFELLQTTDSFIPVPSGRKAEDNHYSPWICQCAFKNKNGIIIPGEVMARALDEKGFAVSTGSACSSAEKKRPVLDAMGVDKEISLGGIRISQGYSTTMEEIKMLAGTIITLLNTL